MLNFVAAKARFFFALTVVCSIYFVETGPIFLLARAKKFAKISRSHNGKLFCAKRSNI